MATQVLEGTWEEITKHAKSLVGRKVRLTILDEPSVSKPQPNVGMLEALRKIKERHKNMPESSDEKTLQMIREGRSGRIFGEESDD
ncbi:MAG TPA: hypothetical protein VK612_02775 [Pyrinomonadaceae bacterium]|nr:hypothetical protein [Pyrinomonadaceae bacterium]